MDDTTLHLPSIMKMLAKNPCEETTLQKTSPITPYFSRQWLDVASSTLKIYEPNSLQMQERPQQKFTLKFYTPSHNLGLASPIKRPLQNIECHNGRHIFVSSAQSINCCYCQMQILVYCIDVSYSNTADIHYVKKIERPHTVQSLTNNGFRSGKFLHTLTPLQ